MREYFGSVHGANNLLSANGVATLAEKASWVTVDFGLEVSNCLSLLIRRQSIFSTLGWWIDLVKYPAFRNILGSSFIFHRITHVYKPIILG